MPIHVFRVGHESILNEEAISADAGSDGKPRDLLQALTHGLEDFFDVLGRHGGVVHVRFVLKYIPDGLNLTAVSFSMFRRCFWPDILGAVIVGLVFVLDHRLDLSDGFMRRPGERG